MAEVLVEFRAGKMILQDGRVSADSRKGLCRILRGEEGLVHVQWAERTAILVEDDLIVFPDEAVFEKVQQSSGRVYILRFKLDDRKLFFWLQETDATGDDELCRLVNSHINAPLQIDEDEGSGEDSVVPTASDQSGQRSAEEGYSQQPVQFADLQRILSNISASAGTDVPMYRDPGPSLSDVLKVETVLPLVQNCHLEERLSPFLPEGHWTLEAIAELMKSPQFRQQLDTFSQALRSGQMDLTQFGIDPSKCDYTVASFLEAIEDQVAAENQNDTRERMEE